MLPKSLLFRSVISITGLQVKVLRESDINDAISMYLRTIAPKLFDKESCEGLLDMYMKYTSRFGFKEGCEKLTSELLSYVVDEEGTTAEAVMSELRIQHMMGILSTTGLHFDLTKEGS